MNKKGFTLIELLIVVTIIGILAVALVPRIIGSSAKARDARRMTDVQTIASGLEYYLLENGNFSNIAEGGSAGGTICSDNATLATDLAGFVKQIPNDPLDSQVNAAFGVADCTGGYAILLMGDSAGGLTRYAIAAHMEAVEGGDEYIFDAPASVNIYSDFSPTAFTDFSSQTPYYIAY